MHDYLHAPTFPGAGVAYVHSVVIASIGCVFFRIHIKTPKNDGRPPRH